MADLLNGIFGKKAAPSPTSIDVDPDFADFDTETADPSPAPNVLINPADKAASAAGAIPALPTSASVRGPYTKWYRVWERTSIADDFYYELYIFPILALLVLAHLWGTRANRRKAQGWFRAHAPILQQEFAVVGFGGGGGGGGNGRLPAVDGSQIGGKKKKDADADAAAVAAASTPGEDFVITDDFLKEKAANEFITYATGRLNIAALEVKMTLHKRYNPFLWFFDSLLGFLFEAIPSPEERVQAVAFSFDGREAKLVPTPRGAAGGEELAESRKKVPNSSYDGFVWAIVHKDCMRRLRDERYDLSLTMTREHPKLPNWATIMTESAEITDVLLTPELIKAVEISGDSLEAFIVSDQPIDQPKTLDDTSPIKRVDLLTRLTPSSSNGRYAETLPLFQQLLFMPDRLVSQAHFRPEALKKVRQTREEESRKIKKVDEDEKAEERKLKADKEKKEKRDALLKSMSAEEQRKYLEKEREKDTRKAQKKRTMRA